MLKITNITDARRNLPTLVRMSREPIVIIQNSKPKAVLISYNDFSDWQKDNEQKEYFAMLKSNPSYIADSKDEPLNYDPKDLKPIGK